MAHGAYGRHAAYVECCAIHDRCIQGGASSMQDSLPDPGGGETSPTTGCSLLRGDRPRAPMQKESPGTIRHVPAREPATQSSGTRTSLPLAEIGRAHV